ncbi:MAG: PEP-CTERM sorting domain-containing protein [Verrucomicrobiota bacterium]
MNPAKSLSLLLFTILGTSVSAFAATVTYTGLPYRGRFDSPFYQSIQNGTTYVEDFEDRFANTPGLSMSTGKTFDSLGQSVDEDEGVLDNLGLGRAWVVPGTAIIPEGSPFTVRAAFTHDALGNYPTHAGAVILGFTTLNVGSLRYFQAFDAAGIEILDFTVESLTPVFPNTTPLLSTKGDRFFGLIHEGGISSIVLGGGLYFDHVQYGYGAIPEPSTGMLAVGGILALALRRKRIES